MNSGTEQVRTATDATASLDERYGRTRADRARLRITLVSLGLAVVVAVGAWVVWVGLLTPTAQIEARDIAHSIVDEHTVDVTFQVTVEPGTRTMCAVEAQDELHTVIGWRIVDIPASEQRTRRFTETVRTMDEATTGLIYRCWQA